MYRASILLDPSRIIIHAHDYSGNRFLDVFDQVSVKAVTLPITSLNAEETLLSWKEASYSACSRVIGHHY